MFFLLAYHLLVLSHRVRRRAAATTVDYETRHPSLANSHLHLLRALNHISMLGRAFHMSFNLIHSSHPFHPT